MQSQSLTEPDVLNQLIAVDGEEKPLRLARAFRFNMDQRI